MARKIFIKKETGTFSSEKLVSWLAKTEKRISNVQYGKDFENLKLVIIKLLSKIKKEPHLAGFEPRLVLLLKDCNLNIQFIRRNDDCWSLVKEGRFNEALEEIIQTLKDINSHPDKDLIRPDIKGIIVDSVKKISEQVDSEVKILPQLNLPKSNIKTLNPLSSPKSPSQSIQTTGNTFKPDIEKFHPFDISAPIENPFKFIDDEKIPQKVRDVNSETYFKSKHLNHKDSKIEPYLDPFPKPNQSQDLSKDQLNSISEYWLKKGKNKIMQHKNSTDIVTQKIAQSNQDDFNLEKKKKTNNPWPAK
ncbi:hypothetical protein DSAG12_02080 [Promethearchaeum syntrophicum]|uniref:Uncharacterized protein n=1 Tax=Promethearchaeum syntrophicum TaxID=2594042 RepID=A0A5B9DBX0_9ARCH|nr:hypothetical protein [Candidatus Prometheoarchaeum syntrophicum]QEE16250.1 hypothetical protein DSAG12_02080 [Candidatus Prometheoarchaeum syntrophicum]